MLSTREFADCVHSFENCQILVVGDLMVDEYRWGHIERISPEAPVPILKVVRKESALGGAGNVVRNLRSIGVGVRVCGIIGEDETGAQIKGLLGDLDIDTHGILCDPNRSSTRKVRLMSLEHGQQVFRMDEETARDVSGQIETQLITEIEEAAIGSRAILCSDYLKGVLTQRVLHSVFGSAKKSGVASVIGPKDPNAQKYRGATILMPNQGELAQLTHSAVDGDRWLIDSMRRLVEDLELEAVVVTRGSRGMSLLETTSQGLRRMDIPAMARSVYDVTGAGDTAIAILTAAIATNANMSTAVQLANLAASIKVGKRGTNTVTIAEIEHHLSEGTTSGIGLQ